MNPLSIAAWAAILLGISGCVTDTEVGSDVSDAGGTLMVADGGDRPADSTAVVVWTVSSGSPDYTYVHGRGEASSTRFTVALSTDPPARALNSYGIGVGVVLLVEPSAAPGDGEVTEAAEEAMEQGLVGATGQYAIIYKEPGAMDLFWTTDFPTGYSCGVADPSREMDPFDGFAPVDCQALEVQVTDDIGEIDWVNWT